MTKILIASPVRRSPTILKEFLWSLEHLETTGFHVEYAFVDDNDSGNNLLQEFALSKKNVRVFPGESRDLYHCSEETHYWREDLIWKVARYKDFLIELAREKQVDYLFLVDSDLVLHPKTLVYLTGLGKDIVSEVYWTRWKPDMAPLPQVWVADAYRLYPMSRGEEPEEAEIARRQKEFLEMLSRPGTYKVGGLGACTLISKRAISLGVSFKEIYNLSFLGEDRHFCIRAAALGLELYADTHFPPYHIYRESELTGLSVPQQNRITLAMLVRNEGGRYLEGVLQHAARYVDEAVILDDASSDNTVEVCERTLQGIPHTIVSNPEPSFHNEIVLRKQLWDLTVQTNPHWILILDADEIFEDRAIQDLKLLASHPDAEVYYFRLYDMWNENHYREDTYWQAHLHYRPLMVRFKPSFCCQWRETPQHCGRFPMNITELKGACSELRLKHLGWMKPEDRLSKFQRYMELDPLGEHGILKQYLSVLDPNPHLLLWVDENKKESSSRKETSQKQLWDQIWANEKHIPWDPLSERIFNTLVSEFGSFSGKSILEAGSGTGRISLRMAGEGARVILVDYSEQALDNSKDFFQNAGLMATFIHADVKALPMEDQVVDMSWNSGVLEHFSPSEQVEALREMGRVTSPGGKIISLNPSARCLPYRIGKFSAEQNGWWPYGEENPVDTLSIVCQEAGLRLLREYHIGFLDALEFMAFIPESQRLKEIMEFFYNQCPKEEQGLFPGYLLVSVMQRL